MMQYPSARNLRVVSAANQRLHELYCMLQISILMIVAVTTFFALNSCTGNDDSTKAADNSADGEFQPIKITATTGMVADIVRNVAGELAIVDQLMQSGVDPHLYQPRREDVISLNDAEIVFYNGLLLEGRMTDVLERIGTDEKPVIAVAEQVADLRDMEKGGNMQHDPHVWMDVQRWMTAVDVVEETLSEHDPDNTATYQANAEQYRKQLEQLAQYAREMIARIPAESRILVTAHDAFGYFGDAYGIDVHGIQGISTESEAGMKDINALIDFLVERKIKAIFVETSVSDKNVRALIEGAKSRGHDIVIGGSLFSDAMGPAGTYEGTYIGMLDHNITTIVSALSDTPHNGGMQGKLGERSN